MSSVSGSTFEDEKWEEEDEWPLSDNEDEGKLSYRSFFDPADFQTPIEAFNHDTVVTHGAFRFLDLVEKMELDVYSVIRLINYLRTLGGDPQKGEEFCEGLKQEGKVRRVWEDDAYLLPVDPNDPLLFLDYEELLSRDESVKETVADVEGRTPEIEHLERENLKLRQEVEWLKLDAQGRDGIQSILETEKSGSAAESSRTLPKQGVCSGQADRAYFSSYSTETIHREMLTDKVRTEAYRDAIEGNKSAFEGKTVLDVGCGSGILALMSCKAGAKHVYAVDASEWAASMTKRIAIENGMQERITVVHGKIEDLHAELEMVDVIVSEWMGYALLFESMLDSVLYARDKWLKPGGCVLPEQARIFLAGADEEALDVGFWQDVYGFSMKPIAEDVVARAQKIPLVQSVKDEHILTSPVVIKELDIRTITTKQTDFTSDFCLSRTKENGKPVAAVIVWFDVRFTHSRPDDSITIDTSPFTTPTHWAQTILALKHSIGQDFRGSISFARDPVSRSLSISLHCPLPSPQTLLYTMDVL